MLFSIINSIYEFRYSFDLGAAPTVQPENHCSLRKRTFLSWFQPSLLCSSFNFSPLDYRKSSRTKTTTPHHQAVDILQIFNHGMEIFFPVKTACTVLNSSFKRPSDEVCLCSGTEFYSDRTSDTHWYTSFSSNDSCLLRSN